MSQILLIDPIANVRARVDFPEASPELAIEPPAKGDSYTLPEGWGSLVFRVCVPNPEMRAAKAKRMEARGDFDELLAEMDEDKRAATEKKREQVYQNIDAQIPLPKELWSYRTLRLPTLSPDSVEKVTSFLKDLGVEL